MTSSHALRDDLCHKLRLVGLPAVVVLPLVNHITRSVACEGAENVVKRLKLLKQAGVNLIAGHPYVRSDLPWIKAGVHGPKGPWKPVWSMLSKGSFKHRKRALNALMVYAAMVFPKRAVPTATQERKFLSSVVQPDVVRLRREMKAKVLATDKLSGLSCSTLRSLSHGLRFNPEVPDYREWISVKRSGDEKRLEGDERNLFLFLGQDFGRAFQGFPEIREALGEELVDDYRTLTHPWHGFDDDWREAVPPVQPIGVVGSSQEPGCKFRAFASPHTVLQCALVPIQRFLLEALKSLPWDCTHDQDSGVAVCQKWLQDGKTVYSVDLSDATNHFPLAYQEEVIKQTFPMLPASSLRLMHLVSRSPYRLMWDRTRLVSWNVGQPLGAGPSFMMFALAHAHLALRAEVMAGIPRSDAGSTFLILGDDIVINHREVHTCYRQLLGELECPVSESKCLVSDVAAEFAGKLIQRDHIFHGFKYKEVSDISFLAVIRSLGSQAISRDLLSSNQYRLARVLIDVPEPYGLGFNPKGIPLSVRWERYLTMKDLLEASEQDPLYVSSATYLNRLMHTWGNTRASGRSDWVSSTRQFWEYNRGVNSDTDESQDQGPSSVPVKPIKQAIYQAISQQDLSIRDVPPGGDPRGVEFVTRYRKVLKVLERLRQDWASEPDVVSDPDSLAPDVFQSGETNPERETRPPTP